MRWNWRIWISFSVQTLLTHERGPRQTILGPLSDWSAYQPIRPTRTSGLSGICPYSRLPVRHCHWMRGLYNWNSLTFSRQMTCEQSLQQAGFGKFSTYEVSQEKFPLLGPTDEVIHCGFQNRLPAFKIPSSGPNKLWRAANCIGSRPKELLTAATRGPANLRI